MLTNTEENYPELPDLEGAGIDHGPHLQLTVALWAAYAHPTQMKKDGKIL